METKEEEIMSPIAVYSSPDSFAQGGGGGQGGGGVYGTRLSGPYGRAPADRETKRGGEAYGAPADRETRSPGEGGVASRSTPLDTHTRTHKHTVNSEGGGEDFFEEFGLAGDWWFLFHIQYLFFHTNLEYIVYIVRPDLYVHDLYAYYSIQDFGCIISSCYI